MSTNYIMYMYCEFPNFRCSCACVCSTRAHAEPSRESTPTHTEQVAREKACTKYCGSTCAGNCTREPLQQIVRENSRSELHERTCTTKFAGQMLHALRTRHPPFALISVVDVQKLRAKPMCALAGCSNSPSQKYFRGPHRRGFATKNPRRDNASSKKALYRCQLAATPCC